MASHYNLPVHEDRSRSPFQTQDAISIAVANPNYGSEPLMKPCTEVKSKGRLSTKKVSAPLPSRSTPSLEKFLIGAGSKNSAEESPVVGLSPENSTALKDVSSLRAVDHSQEHDGMRDTAHVEESKLQPFLQSGGDTEDAMASAVKPSKKRGRPRCLFSSSQADASSGNPEQVHSGTTEQTPRALKRKRFSLKLPLDPGSKPEILQICLLEIASLQRFYREEGRLEFGLKDEHVCGGNSTSLRAEIALLLEESQLTFSSLIESIFKKLSQKCNLNDVCELTLASLRTTVLSIAQRVCYGVANPDADVLEDNSESCLWCWEVRDLKLLPEAYRDNISIRRRRRRKIADRICALSVMMSVLLHENVEDISHSLCKAKENLDKVDDEYAIRAYVAGWIDRQKSKRREKEIKLKEKDALKEQQRQNRESEKEQRRLDREAEKTLLLQVKEKKRMEKEANKQQVRAHKEASRQEKDLRRQQEEAEKELKRREKEATELKRQAALQKQATILDRFLQSKKDSMPLSSDCDAQDVCQTGQHVFEEVVARMDKELFESSDKQLEELFSFNLASWKKVGKSYSLSNLWWGLRRLAKVSISRELCLQKGSSEAAACQNLLKHDMVQVSGNKRPRQDSEEDGLRLDKLEMDWEDSSCVVINECFFTESRSDGDRDLLLRRKRRKLLQFDKSYRPAYYGTFSKKSHFIKPRNPFVKDPNLDYENDSDEEWEEEDPGESLSDCDKDEEDDKADVEEEDENADGFVVPDGYLSENEGVHLEDAESDDENESLVYGVPNVPTAAEGILDSQSIGENNQDLKILERQQKLLESVTDQALKCNRAFIISNLAKDGSIIAMSRTERICLQALRIHIITDDIMIEPPIEETQLIMDVPQCQRQKKEAYQLPDSILPEMVDIISSSSKSLNKTVDMLLTKFPSASKSQLRSKIREVAEFVDNHWQVKRDVMEQHGIQTPHNSAPCTVDTVAKPLAINGKPITKFFIKRTSPREEAEGIVVPIEDGMSDKNLTKVDTVS